MITIEELQKIVPQNLEAEMSLLGSLLLDKQAIYQIIDFIEPKDFYDNKNKLVYSVYLEMFNKGKSIDLSTLMNEINNKDIEMKNSFVTNLFNSVITSAHVVEYANIVKDKSLRRQILEAQHKNENVVYDEDKEINSVLANIQNNLYEINPFKISNDTIQSALKDLDSLQEEYSRKYEEGKHIIGFSSGINKLDDIIDGLRPGHLWVVGAWHGTGKTSFALNIVHHLLEQNVPISIISTEMSQVDLTAKLIGIRHQMSSMKVIKGKLDHAQSERIREGKMFLNQSNLEIHTEFDFEKIKMQIRKDVYVRKVKVVMVDYIQKMTDGKIYEETPLMARISQGLSNLAQDLKITIILLSQISNEAQKGSGAGAGFKGSGAIEASADFAVVLKRDKTKEMPNSDWVEMKVQITKNKFGLDGVIDMWFHLASGQVKLTPNDI